MTPFRYIVVSGAAVLAGSVPAFSQDSNSRSQVQPPRVSQAEPQRTVEREEEAAERLQRRAERRAQRERERAANRAAQQTENDAQPADQNRSEGAVQAQTTTEAEVRTRTFIRASDLIGLRVRGTGDAELGTVQDVFIDPLTFGVQYVVLDTGAGISATGRLPILPWALFQTTAGSSLSQGFLVVPLSLERLQQAPTIATTDPELADSAAWVSDVDAFFADDIRETRVSRPDFDDAAPDEVNDRDSLPIGRRPVTPGTPGTETDARSNPNGVFERSNRGRANRGAPQTGAHRSPELGGTRESSEGGSGNTDPPGNTPATGNPPGGRTPPGNADAIDNPPGGRNPPGNTGATDNAPGGTRPPGNAGSTNSPGGANPPGNTPAPQGSTPGAGSNPGTGTGSGTRGGPGPRP